MISITKVEVTLILCRIENFFWLPSSVALFVAGIIR